MKLSRRTIVRSAVLVGVGLGVVLVAYLVLLCHPGLFFGHALTRGGITLYSDDPIHAEAAGPLLDEVGRRLARSPLADDPRARGLRLYLCNRRWRFALFANVRHQVGGLAYPPLSDNIFLRPSRPEANRLIGPSGQDVPGERTLVYFMTHEIMHVLIARELGAVAYWRLPAWKNEGYADQIAKAGKFDYERVRGQLRRGDRELDPKRSGLYLRYHLLVAYLLERRGIGISDLLHREFDPARLEEELLASEGGDAS
jgi:hypothetical protein